MPVGSGKQQRLTLVGRTGTDMSVTTLDDALFVPLIGEYGVTE